jgi:hypothetical protein
VGFEPEAFPRLFSHQRREIHHGAHRIPEPMQLPIAEIQGEHSTASFRLLLAAHTGLRFSSPPSVFALHLHL